MSNICFKAPTLQTPRGQFQQIELTQIRWSLVNTQLSTQLSWFFFVAVNLQHLWVVIDSLFEPASGRNWRNCNLWHFQVGLIFQPQRLPLGAVHLTSIHMFHYKRKIPTTWWHKRKSQGITKVRGIQHQRTMNVYDFTAKQLQKYFSFDTATLRDTLYSQCAYKH